MAQPRAYRRIGYAIAALVNGVLFVLMNVSPGWQVVPFLTDELPQVLGILNLSLIAGVIANVLFILVDRVWLKAFGDLITVSIGVVVLVRLWQVFPFDFSGSTVDWALLLRVVLAVSIAGAAIAIIVQLAVLARSLIGRDRRPAGRTTTRP
jgi:hypothetical protein